MKVAENVVNVIKLMIRSGEDVSVAEVGRHLSLNRSTASRLLASLRDGGLLEQCPLTQKYRPGVLALQFGMRARNNYDVLNWITSEAESVVQLTGHTVCIGVLDRTDVMIINTRKRAAPIYLALDIGTRIQAHASAMGKVILSEMSDDQVRKTLPEMLEKTADNTRDNIEDLLKDLETIRSNGYAISRNELANGIASYAVALKIRDDLTISIGVAFLTNEQHSDEYAIVSALLNFKSRIAQELVYLPKN